MIEPVHPLLAPSAGWVFSQAPVGQLSQASSLQHLEILSKK